MEGEAYLDGAALIQGIAKTTDGFIPQWTEEERMEYQKKHEKPIELVELPCGHLGREDLEHSCGGGRVKDVALKTPATHTRPRVEDRFEVIGDHNDVLSRGTEQYIYKYLQKTHRFRSTRIVNLTRVVASESAPEWFERRRRNKITALVAEQNPGIGRQKVLDLVEQIMKVI